MNDRSATVALTCPRCSVENPTTNEFCRECGNGLAHECPNCLKKVSIAERFCGNCGSNLEEHRNKEIAALQGRFNLLDSLEAELKYPDAILIAKTLVRMDAERFPIESARAKQRLAELTAAREAAEAAVEAIAAAGKELLARREYMKAATRLAEIQPNLRTPQAVDLLAEAVDKARKSQELRTEIQQQLKANPLAIYGKISQLLELHPDETKLEEIGRQLRERVLTAARGKRDSGAILDAARLLGQIPSRFVDEQVQLLRRECDDVLWLERDLKESPFVDATLVEFAKRLAKAAPKHPRARQWFEESHKRLQEGAGRGVAIPWVAGGQPMFGSGIRWLDPLAGLAVEGVEIAGGKQAVGRFTVAIGLALQAIDSADVKELLTTGKESKGLLSKLGMFAKKRTSQRGWGIDIGSSSLKAAKLSSDGQTVKVEALRVIEYRKELPSTRNEAEQREVVRGALVKLQDEAGIGNDPCVVSLDAKGSLFRFLSLPGVAESKFDKIVELEAKYLIPYPLDQVYWYSHRFETSAAGNRAVMIVAARRGEVDGIADLLEQHDFKVSGFQCEPIAILNLLRRQKSGATGADESVRLLIDIGATSCQVVAMVGNQAWLRTVSHGGSRISAAVARELHLTFAQAEELKLAPHQAVSPLAAYRAMAKPLAELLGEVERSVRAAEQAGIPTRQAEVLLSGGGAGLHGLARAFLHGTDGLALEAY